MATLVKTDSDLYSGPASRGNTQQSLLTLRAVKERMLSAGIGATLVALTVTPLDVVKVRLQADSPRNYVFCGNLYDRVQQCVACPPSCSRGMSTAARFTGTLDGIICIARVEGVSALYRGLLPSLAMSIPATIIYFVGYEGLKEQLRGIESLAPLLAGSSARMIAATAISPLELLKTRMQHGNGTVFKEMAGVFNLVRRSGPSVMFAGLVPTLWRDVPFSGIYWTGYEFFRSLLPNPQDLSSQGTFLSSFLSGAASGAIAATLTIPFDVAKTRRQVHISHGGIYEQLTRIWREEGLTGLTRGWVPRVAKVAPACAIMISSYELGKRILGSL